MHHIFPPQQKQITDKTGAKIPDSQNSFALIAENNKEMDIKVELLKLCNTNIQPLLLVTGEPQNK